MDPNLLPENLRTKETKELDKLKGQSRGSRIELHAPSVARPNLGLANSDRPKVSWWQKLTGVAKTPAEFDPKMSNPLLDKPTSSHMDWLDSRAEAKLPKARPVHPPRSKAPTRIKTPRVKAPKKPGLFKSLFGLPVSPILSEAELRNFTNQAVVVPAKALAPAVANQQTITKPQPTVAPKLPPAKTVFIDTKQLKQPVRVPQASWWQIIKGLFGLSRHHEEKLKFARVATPLVTRGKPTPVATAGIKPAVLLKKIKTKTAIKPSYNLVSKIEKREINVNFVPPEMRGHGYIARLAKRKVFFVAAVLAVLVVAGSYFLLNYLQQNLQLEMSTKNSELLNLNLQLEDFIVERSNNNKIASRVTATKKIIDEKARWSKFFTLLEKYTLAGVYYGSLSADTTGSITLPGIATDYETLAEQLVVYNSASDFTQAATISNAHPLFDPKGELTGVGFQIKLTLRDQVFRPTK